MNSFFKIYIFYILGFTSIMEGARFRCDYKYCKYSKAWFKYHVVPAVWHDARRMCILEGAMLASPTTYEIRATMKKSTGAFPIFTGFHSTFSKGKYYNIDGIPLDSIQHFWASREPDNRHNNESCLSFNNLGQFADVSCDEPRPYMCYRNVIEDINECGTHDDEYELDSRTEHCYKLHLVPQPFERALFTCAAEGGYLAIINSVEESKVLKDVFAKHKSAHIVGKVRKDIAFVGYSNWKEGGDWRTIHGQTLREAGYEKWSSGEPTNYQDDEYCGSIYPTGLLNDISCDREALFICEKSPDYPPVCDNDEQIPEEPEKPINFGRSRPALQIARQDKTLI